MVSPSGLTRKQRDRPRLLQQRVEDGGGGASSFGLEDGAQRVAQPPEAGQVARRQLAGQVAVADAREHLGQPAEVDEPVGRVLEQVVAVDEQQGELDVGRGAAGSASQSPGKPAGPSGIALLQSRFERQLLEGTMLPTSTRQSLNPH